MLPKTVVAIAAPNPQPYAMLDPVRDSHPNSLSRVFSAYGCCAKDLCSSLFKKCMFWRKEESPELRAAAQPLAPGNVSPISAHSSADFEVLLPREQPGCLCTAYKTTLKYLDVLKRYSQKPLVLFPALLGSLVWAAQTVSTEGQFIPPVAIATIVAAYTANSLLSPVAARKMNRLIDLLLPLVNYLNGVVFGDYTEYQLENRGYHNAASIIDRITYIVIPVMWGVQFTNRLILFNAEKPHALEQKKPSDQLYSELQTKFKETVTQLKAIAENSTLLERDPESREDLFDKLLISEQDFKHKVETQSPKTSSKLWRTCQKTSVLIVPIFSSITCFFLSRYLPIPSDNPIYTYSMLQNIGTMILGLTGGAFGEVGLRKLCEHCISTDPTREQVVTKTKAAFDLFISISMGLLLTPSATNIAINFISACGCGFLMQKSIDSTASGEATDAQKCLTEEISKAKVKLLELLEKNKDSMDSAQFKQIKTILNKKETDPHYGETIYLVCLTSFIMGWPFVELLFPPPEEPGKILFQREAIELWAAGATYGLSSIKILPAAISKGIPAVSMLFYWYFGAIIKIFGNTHPDIHRGHPAIETLVGAKAAALGPGVGASFFSVIHDLLQIPNFVQTRYCVSHLGAIIRAIWPTIANHQYLS